MSGGNGGTSSAGGKADSSGDGSRMEETTGGVINGLIHDVEKGVDEITGETSVQETGTVR